MCGYEDEGWEALNLELGREVLVLVHVALDDLDLVFELLCDLFQLLGQKDTRTAEMGERLRWEVKDQRLRSISDVRRVSPPLEGRVGIQ